MKSECEKLTQSLLDLVYDELPDAESEQLRSHAASCPACREQIEGMLLTRKMVAKVPPPPPLNLDESTLFKRAFDATEQFSDNANSNVETWKTSPHASSAIDQRPSFAVRLRRFLLTPALATTAAATVVFVVSYFVLEQSVPLQNMDEETLLVPTIPALSAPVPPNELLQEEAISPHLDKSAGVASDRTGSLEVAPSLARSKRTSPLSPTNDRWNPAKAAPEPSKVGTASGATSSNRLATRASSNSSTRGSEKRPKAADRRNATKMHPVRDGLGEIELDGEREASTRESPPPVSTVKRTPHPSAKDLESADALYERGLAAYLRGDCKTAVTAFDELQRTPGISTAKRMIALHHLGRCEKRRGSCGKALTWYEKLLSGYPTYPQRSTALWESSSCHRKLGHIDRARVQLIELSKDPAWESRALGELEKIGGYSRLD